MKSHLKTGLVIAENVKVLDMENAEIVSDDTNVTKHTYIAGKDEFYLMYSYFINVLLASKDLKLQVFAFLFQRNSTGLEFTVGKPLKDIMATKFNVTIGAISNVLTQLKKENLLYSSQKGLYVVNSRYIFRGSSKERNNKLKYVIELGCKDC